MKTSRVFALAAVLASVPLAALSAEEEAGSGLAVLRAENRVESSWWDEVGSEWAQNALIGRLEENGQYEVMPRVQMAETMAAKRLWRLGELSPAGAVRLGRELGVRYLLVTSVVEFGTGGRGLGRKRGRKLLGLGAPKNFNTEIILRLIDTTAGGAVWSDSRSAATPLAGLLSSTDEEGARVEEAVFESAVLPLLSEMAAQLSADFQPAPMSQPDGDDSGAR